MSASARTAPGAALAGAVEHHRAGRLDEAIAAYRKAARLEPDALDAYLGLGNALAARGDLEHAVASFRRALALAPGSAYAHYGLAVVLEAQGRCDEALSGFQRALEIEDQRAFGVGFARCLMNATRASVDAGLRRCVARAITEAWARPADLARPAIGMLLGDPRLREPLETALRAWPARPAAQALLEGGVVPTLADDPLLVAVLENAQVCDPYLERFLTAVRHALLEQATNGAPPGDDAIALACALARQCFLNDYVFALTGHELERAAALKDGLAAALRAQAPIEPASVALVACYFPLAALADARALLARSWPRPLRALLAQQVEEPATERELAAAMPRLTTVSDTVSQRVQRQYEESPYPRWVRVPLEEPVSLDAYLRRLMPQAALPAPGTIADRDILVAGCGTGQESVALARLFPASRLLAIDLSIASLAYAQRMTRSLGLANVEYAQADILELEAPGREFDMISSVGVLHHLADPLAGWRRLVRLLRPGGFMQVGLYSETGRRDLAAARSLVAERGHAPDAEGIRRCRAEILDSGRFPRVARLRDLYGMNECRDLLFHVQEHRFTLPQVRSMVGGLGLEFVGLAVAPVVARAFAQRFPGAAANDLDAWDAFEAQFPDTFAGMYLFWVRKPAQA